MFVYFHRGCGGGGGGDGGLESLETMKLCTYSFPTLLAREGRQAGWLAGWTDESIDGCMDVWMYGCMDGIDAWLHGWTDRCLYDGWMA